MFCPHPAVSPILKPPANRPIFEFQNPPYLRKNQKNYAPYSFHNQLVGIAVECK